MSAALAQQLNAMMRVVVPVNADPELDAGSFVQETTKNLETARSSLALFVASSGPFQDALGRAVRELFDAVDALSARVLREPPRRRPTASGAVVGGAAGPPASEELLAAGGDDGSDAPLLRRCHQLEGQLSALAAEALAMKTELRASVEALTAENAKLRELLVFQSARGRHRPAAADTAAASSELMAKLAAEMDVAALEQRLQEAEHEAAEQRARVEDLRQLNGKYALQAMELAIRIKVLQDHNERFATSLALQQDEKAALARENDVLKGELLELSRLGQLHEGYDGAALPHFLADRRDLRYGLGNNPSVPRHLMHCGLLNRIVMPKDVAQSLASAIVASRRVRGGLVPGGGGAAADFQEHIHAFLFNKHGKDALAWAYALDEATQSFDGNVGLNVFGLVSRRVLSEHFFQVLALDLQLFLEACELVDLLQHQAIRLTVPVLHVVGLLAEMFPGYPESAFKRIVDGLTATLTVKAHTHYRMLFPNLEREVVRGSGGGEGALAGVEARQENPFSSTFKELVLDDAVITMQRLDDAMAALPASKVKVGDIAVAVGKVFEHPLVQADVLAAVKTVLSTMPGFDQFDAPVHKSVVMAFLRAKLVLRSGVYRTTADPAAVHPFFERYRRDWESHIGGGDEAIPEVNYREILQKCTNKRSAAFA